MTYYYKLLLLNKLYRIYYKLLNYIGSIGSIDPVILVNVYMLSVQVMKRTIKLLPLLGRHLASRAIKQLNEHITTAVLNTGRQYNT